MQFDMKLKTKGAEREEILAHEYIGVKGYKAKGKRLSANAVRKIGWLEPLEDVGIEAGKTEERPAVIDLDEKSGIEKEIGTKVKFRFDAVEAQENVIAEEPSAELPKKTGEPGEARQMELPL